MRRRRWPALLPVLVLSALAAALALEAERRLEAPDGGTARAALPIAKPEPAATGGPADTALGLAGSRRHLARATVTGNLFAIDRRPPPETGAQPVQSVAQQPQARQARRLDVRLTGVVLAGERSIAVLEDMRGETVLRLRPGERVQDWELVELSVLGARFRNGGYERMVTMSFGDRDTETPEANAVAIPRRSAEEPAPPPLPRRAREFSFPDYESGTAESMQGHAGGGLRPASGGAGGNVRDGTMAPAGPPAGAPAGAPAGGE